MTTTSYAIDTTEEDGQSTAYLTHKVGQKYAVLEVDYSDSDTKEAIASESVTISLTELARLGRVAQAILDGRDPSERNYDRKAATA